MEKFETVCRFCLQNENLVVIYKRVNFGRTKYYLNKDVQELFEHNYVEIRPDDDLPNYVCQNCEVVLKNWHNFKQTCKDSYDTLWKIRNTFQPNSSASDKIEDIETENIKHEAIEIEDNCDYRDLEGSDDDKSEESKPVRRKKSFKSKPTLCTTCGVIVTRSYTDHMLKHAAPDGRPYKCEKCPKSFLRNEILKRHIRRDHLMIRYPCEICDKIYTTRAILKIHLKTHNTEYNYKCNICDKSFKCAKNLYKHKQSHNGVKKYICSYCGKQFRLSEYLKDHVRIHTGERPYLCKVCGKSFITAKHLRQHNRTHTGEQPFKCTFCDRAFGNKKSLDRHKLTHANEQQLIATQVV